MASDILRQESALSAHHEGLARDEQSAVIFNEKASAQGLLSFAHGQIALLDSILSSLGKYANRDEGAGDLADSVRALLAPASKALELAVQRIPPGSPQH